MIDMLFYHDKNLYSFYNLHDHLPLTGKFDEMYLCLRNNETVYTPVFPEYTSLNEFMKANGGNINIVIQYLSRQFDNPVVDIVAPLASYPNKGRIRSNDINIDGYPDIFITLSFNNI